VIRYDAGLTIPPSLLQRADQVIELEKCRTQKNPNLADLAELALYTGMRQGELLGLTWDRVDGARGVVLLERTKSGRRREVPLNGPADAILARRTPEKRPVTDSCSTPGAGTPSAGTRRPR
jgi:integrase